MIDEDEINTRGDSSNPKYDTDDWNPLEKKLIVFGLAITAPLNPLFDTTKS